MGTTRPTWRCSSRKKAGTNPRELATKVASLLRGDQGIAGVEVAGPGFLNITVDAGSQGQVAADIVAAGAAYGTSNALDGERINVEFISANPTGPLHLGHTRWAAVGDALARVLEAAGAPWSPGVLHQRPRVADGQVRGLDPGAGAGGGGAGGRVPR